MMWNPREDRRRAYNLALAITLTLAALYMLDRLAEAVR
jgi:hypothetical protein